MAEVEDVRAYLIASDLVDGSTGWPSSPHNLHDDSAQLVVIADDGGRPPELAASVGVGSGASQFPTVQVRVRAGRYDTDLAAAKARAIQNALHSLNGQTLGSTRYEFVRALSSPARFLDDNQRPNYTQSFELQSPVPV